MTDKSDDGVGNLNTILARGGGNLNDPIFKSSNARALPGGGGDVEVSSWSAHYPKRLPNIPRKYVRDMPQVKYARQASTSECSSILVPKLQSTGKFQKEIK